MEADNKLKTFLTSVVALQVSFLAGQVTFYTHVKLRLILVCFNWRDIALHVAESELCSVTGTV
jgi:hypothetical protein